MDSSAAIGTPVEPADLGQLGQRPAGLLDVLQAAGRRGQHLDRVDRLRDVQAPLASTRILPPGPSASRTAATRRASAARSTRGSATLTFAVRQPDALTNSAARSGAPPEPSC